MAMIGWYDVSFKKTTALALAQNSFPPKLHGVISKLTQICESIGPPFLSGTHMIAFWLFSILGVKEIFDDLWQL